MKKFLEISAIFAILETEVIYPMKHAISTEGELRPHVVTSDPVNAPGAFTMTRFCPMADGFGLYGEDQIVIIDPPDVIWESPVVPRSRKTLDEHIRYIRDNNIRKALVIAEDIAFLRQCPSLEEVRVIPPYSAATFDYSPLYDLPNLKVLNCQTIYGFRDKLLTQVDYSHFSRLESLYVCGKKGHLNLHTLKGLKELSFAQGQPSSKTLTDLDVSSLVDLDLCQSPIQTLAGLENAKFLSKLVISYCRQLEDISALASIQQSLTLLDIESCGKIKDFTVLNELHNLEHLRLYGSNTLPNLTFLKQMPKLRTFTFTMNVTDGDLSLCMNVPYASCRNKKHYNLKDADLPKRIRK